MLSRNAEHLKKIAIRAGDHYSERTDRGPGSNRCNRHSTYMNSPITATNKTKTNAPPKNASVVLHRYNCFFLPVSRTPINTRQIQALFQTCPGPRQVSTVPRYWINVNPATHLRKYTKFIDNLNTQRINLSSPSRTLGFPLQTRRVDCLLHQSLAALHFHKW